MKMAKKKFKITMVSIEGLASILAVLHNAGALYIDINAEVEEDDGVDNAQDNIYITTQAGYYEQPQYDDGGDDDDDDIDNNNDNVDNNIPKQANIIDQEDLDELLDLT